MNKPKVVILGGGFGGLAAARALYKDADVTVVDRHNYQTFLPLLYQVSTAGLAADHVAYPIRGALRKTSVKFRMASPINIDHRNKEVKLDSSEILKFDHLIVALGSVTADFGIPGVKEFALGMKSVSEALTIRAEIMRRFEDLCRFEDDTKFSVTVIGGGPTGVEMAGAIAELIRGPLKSDQAQVAKNISVTLVEAGPRLLPPFAPSLSARTKKDLEKLGVKVLLNTAVKELAHRKIFLKDGTSLQSEITIWAAGVKGSDAMKDLNLPVEANRVAVEPTMQVKNYPNVWALGDIAGAKGKDGGPLPMVAPVAIQQGKFIAKQIKRISLNKQLEHFKYLDKGSMATIGRNKAVVQVRWFKLAGPLAWLVWLWLHLFYLLGGRNKIGTMADWTWNYLTFDRGNRHIMDSQ
ncbi:NADH dehydrogenase [Candidatus Nanopelagicus limnes]|uniref:NADH:ubiquinone reductase (non-electrogenic) n=1 Tax=Candidatus Nanopelagicus limnae TaxID=1884634 RepID=A0A249JZ70_9ACTN|nr:NAD(P)/FAD-dependent oxidoreductase [Candidatus Nanopelagicus limnes]ASY09806.1 NADH dehydrogenase [Candidatus Nanopelagicus limnes]